LSRQTLPIADRSQEKLKSTMTVQIENLRQMIRMDSRLANRKLNMQIAIIAVSLLAIGVASGLFLLLQP